MPEIAVSILGITGLLALTSLLPPFANRLNLPLSVMLAGVGCALGALRLAATRVEKIFQSKRRSILIMTPQ